MVCRTRKRPGDGTQVDHNDSRYLKGNDKMHIRFLRWAAGVLVVAAVVFTAGRSWAIFSALGPSKDEWGLKYDVEVNNADGDTMTVVFTLADEGRLKPFYSLELIAFSKETDNQGGHSYDVKAPIEFKTTKDGRRVGQVQIRKEFADRAQIRILTNTVDGKPQTAGLAYYLIPINKFLNKAPSAASPIASPPTSKVIK
jgi:hypothetical protein